MRRIVTICVISFIISFCSSTEVKIDPEQKGDLTIKLDDLRNGKGRVMFAIIAEDDKLAVHDPTSSTASIMIAASLSDQIEVTLPDLPNGKYAILHIHDENGNGKMDYFISQKEWLFFNPFVWPDEGYGYSTVHRPGIGAPAFENMEFVFNGKKHTEHLYTSYFWDRYAILVVLAINVILSGGPK
jgi:uncharacterized protein (DUF2141 family)